MVFDSVNEDELHAGCVAYCRRKFPLSCDKLSNTRRECDKRGESDGP